MNANDKIELPPPAQRIPYVGDVWTRDQIQSAIEADRQRRGEPYAWLYFGPYSRMPCMMYESEPPQIEYESAKNLGGKIIPVYAAPQPAEPSRGEPVGYINQETLDWLSEPGRHGTAACVATITKSTSGDNAAAIFADPVIKESLTVAEPVNHAVRIYNSGYMAGHQDTVEGCFTDILSADMATCHEDVVSELLVYLRSHQPAEPVKVPSDAEVASLALKHEAHGEKWPDAEYRFREVDLVSFAHALLARYGQK